MGKGAIPSSRGARAASKGAVERERSIEASEDELLRRFRGGDESAFEGVAVRFHPELLQLAYRMTGDREEAREIGQLALLRAHETLTSFRGGARLSTWLYRVVLNLCRDRHRKRTANEDRLALLAPLEPPRSRSEVPAERAEERELAERVAVAVRALPPLEREVVVLRHYHDLSFAEIGLIQGAPATTVKSRMTKGLCLLRGRLKDLES